MAFITKEGRQYEAPKGAIAYLCPSAEGVSDQKWIFTLTEAAEWEQKDPMRLILIQ